ncbi:hypothetical protein B0O80DRAFT_482234 [Mortierella sp. GBAus27b]|nr:hypothetical protein B0O80DRAFT_482234 [Mortierella sp. GBAus27b]
MSDPTEKEVAIPWPGKTAITVTVTTPPEGTELSGFGLILGPGAGGDEKTPLLTSVANEVARQGHFCARYRAKVPNLGFRVSACLRVMEHLFHPTLGVHPLRGCFLGGHSMGTRVCHQILMCSHALLVAGTVAAQVAGGSSATTSEESAPTKKTGATAKAKKGAKAKATASTSSTPTTDNNAGASMLPSDFVPGLLLFSYPLHTADNTKALRDQILYDIPPATSTLFVSGLKDNMCQPAIFAKVFKDMKALPREVIQVVDADHGLGFGSSKPAQAKKEALCTAITEWSVSYMDDTIATMKGETKRVSKPSAIKKKAELKKVADEWTVGVSTIA